ncbi:MAG TPA: M13 family metallopeptidase [Candidatus Polarisedimenticolaceae bacterium]|nr:M13 family metallopeptidase [Candidatus Polarisedimenticolaceae bacterium]
MRGTALLLAAALCAAPALAADASASGVASTVKAAMDTKTEPCQDFYRYACGGWLDSTKIPADQSRWGRGFSEIAERNRTAMREILDDAVKNPGDDPGRQKLGMFYGACMDESGIEEAGVKPIADWMKDAAKTKNDKNLMTMVGKLHAATIPAFFNGGVEADFKDPNTNIMQLFQGGLGLPDRDYYLSDDKKDKREAYAAHIEKMFTLYGDTPDAAKATATKILAFETEIAKISKPRAELRDPDKTYHKLDITGLKKLTPNIDWDAYLKAAGHPEIVPINVAVPEFYQGLEKLLGSTDDATIQAYLRWKVLHDAAPALPKAFDQENFAFYGKVLSGQKEQQARWKRCVIATDGALGEILGQEFIKKQFAGDSKRIARELVEAIQTAFASGLPSLDWMDDTTRQRALGKKAAIVNKIGYPDKWRDYSKLKLKKGDYFANVVASSRFEFEREANKIGKPVDKTEWGMTPPTVNAYYNPLNNEMVFPAGILQPPFFSKDFPMAMNFGGMGMVMGHELTHGFDDQGRKFDATGKLTEWWEPAVSDKFEERAACIEKQYTGYEVQPGLHLNGKLTLGENIADNGGIKETYTAFKAWEAKNPGSEKPIVDGLTNDQLMFVAFAQTWCSLATPQIEQMLVTVDPHSPPRFRVNGPLSNSQAFAEAFSCAEGTPMHPTNRCTVW